ncbi:glu/Leu/Phe/Val dehydrogenase, dimerization domain protein [Burkholderia thailandensis MSMB121]|uniref:Glu/Leu/Phe/Val dehydrogenase n=2 Tax=Burkholderia humptydooensis TaxID=430531 RepID=A0A7U4PBB0_9BURK|nr:MULTISPECIES: Glu/Leu/Phe/Val dehydrogenase dimerization domain-containing protein [Burkholderia]AGK50812.1 glu/Leu/Phe/Val dehydrogenase, dimerization domain protein [Burkholderia thailandensis MSMB121]ATF33302.1 leucine dehydrogenase [Burkholderia thailandensis]AJY38481.1 glu/Leu/Phe/Val dehydrogenase, dimerization domain protein [Burkholderia sp. 2002721687]ALX46362.1 leucine dehydrogenase [Burkholderia humptydooensis]EIP85788.1 putative leucine dehydrogenase [Burkholderia humptydooensis
MAIINHPRYGKYEVETIVVDDQSSFTIACSPRRHALPSNGGIRWHRYDSLSKQKDEAVMLAHAMDLKHGLYRTGFSGGKIVVNSNAAPDDAQHVFDAIGETLNRYAGSMYTGCDINTSSTHMAYLRKSTQWILDAMDNPQINTSIATGYGVWSALLAVLQFTHRSTDTPLVAIHGMGKVGREVARQCLERDYDVVGFDVRPSPEIPTGVRMLSEDEFWPCASDVLCVASLSGILDMKTVDRIRTRWVVSSSNSPFESPEAEAKLIGRGIGYLPDYVSNAGAVICDSVERSFPDVFRIMTQNQANEYTGALIGAKTEELLKRSHLLGCNIPTLLSHAH